MNFSKNGAQTNEAKLSATSRVTSLNPNAAEFIPLSLRSSSFGNTSTSDATTRFNTSGTSGKAVVDRSESFVSNNSDEEAHQSWHQLPEDITLDYKVMGEDKSRSLGNLTLADLSLHDDSDASRFPPSGGGGFLLSGQQDLSKDILNGNQFAGKLRYSAPSYGVNQSSASFLHILNKPWEKQVPNSNRVSSGQEGLRYDGNSRHGFMTDMVGEQAIMDDTSINPLEFLGLRFPGLAIETLLEVYLANGGNLNQTFEMLTQLEFRVDASLNQNLTSKTFSSPNLSAMDIHALCSPDGQNGPKFSGDDFQQSGNSFRSLNKDDSLLFKASSLIPSRGLDFASTVKKVASQDLGIWKYDRNGLTETIGSSINSHLLSGTYNSSHGRGFYSDKLQNRGSAQSAPIWLDTGDAIGNMYPEQREEVRDHTRLRNAYVDQARQSYIMGANKVSAKELSVKGQFQNMKYLHRNPVGLEMQGNGREQERIIDLYGLNVSEAIHLLKHEVSTLRTTARAMEQRLQVYICVGAGQQTRGPPRTPTRLPSVVQRYLLEEEGLDFTEPQPGLLKVVIY